MDQWLTDMNPLHHRILRTRLKSGEESSSSVIVSHETDIYNVKENVTDARMTMMNSDIVNANYNTRVCFSKAMIGHRKVLNIYAYICHNHFISLAYFVRSFYHFSIFIVISPSSIICCLLSFSCVLYTARTLPAQYIHPYSYTYVACRCMGWAS